MFKLYELDRAAQELVLEYRDAGVLNESHKMRMTVPYGLERFWGEHLRLKIQATKGSEEKRREAENKGNYWKSVWNALVEIMGELDEDGQPVIRVPNDDINPNAKDSTDRIKKMATKLWGDDKNEPFPEGDRKIALVVLTQLCDSLVWWTQRYKKVDDKIKNEG